MPEPIENRRRTDGTFGMLTRVWDWIDSRDIDKHVVSIAVMIGTYNVTHWAMWFASNSTRPGIEVAAIIGAVLAPYSVLQAAALKWYFEARTS